MTPASPPSAAPLIQAAKDENAPRGIAFMLVGTLSFAMLDGLAKWVVTENPIMQVVAIRSVFVLLFLAPLVLRAGGARALATRRPWAHALRALLSLGAMLCFLAALREMPLATATTLGFTAPLFMTALSVPLLGERVGRHRWAAVVVGFVGVLAIAGPGGDDVALAPAALAVLSALFFAGAMLTVRWLAPTESDAAMMVFQNLGVGLVAWIVAPLVWQPIAWFDVALIGGAAAFLIVSQLCMIGAFRSAPVGAVVPFQYAELVWTAIIGYLVWRDIPGFGTWTGASIIVTSGIYIIWRERRGRLPSTNR